MRKVITAAILAGGPGSRMKGILKPGLLIDGKTILSRTLDAIRDIFDELILVTNKPEEFIKYKECIVVSDHYRGIGPLGGIHAGLQNASNDSVFIFAGDMPLLNTELIERQIGLFKVLNCDILVPKTGSSIEPLHSICRRSVLNQLDKYLSDEKDHAVREFLRTVDTRYMDLDETEEILNIFSNINIPSDIRKIEKILKSEK
jgi:molybdenum cofactor guanylyltransferase